MPQRAPAIILYSRNKSVVVPLSVMPITSNVGAASVRQKEVNIPPSLTKQHLQLRHPEQKYSNDAVELSSEFLKLFIVEARRRAAIEVSLCLKYSTGGWRAEGSVWTFNIFSNIVIASTTHATTHQTGRMRG